MAAKPRMMGAVQAVASQWAGHMRRGASLKSEKDYLAALTLIPQLAERRQSLLRTLRGLADLYAEEGRLEDACLLFERISQEATAPTRIFWCDYARLLFRLAEEQLRGKKVAAGNASLEKARQIASKAPGHSEMASLCREGYLGIGTLFEQAGDWVPAELYIGRAVEIPPQIAEPDAIQVYSELAWRAYWRRDFERADHWALNASQASPHALHGKLGMPVARTAALLGALGAAAVQNHLPKVCDHFFSWGERLLREAAPQGSVELADLLVAWGSCSSGVLGESRFQEALNLRELLLGERHPKTRELRAALGLEGPGGFQSGFGHGPAAAPEIRPAFKRARSATEAELKGLQRSLIKLCHPDQSQEDGEFEYRNKMMIEINAATKEHDGARLLQLSASIKSGLKARGWLRNA